MTDPELAAGVERGARLDVLTHGYAELPRVAGTISLIREDDRVIVVDPGMVSGRHVVLDRLREVGVAPEEVTDVVITHHHPDHTVNIALFGEVPVHDFQAVYHRDQWTRRPADGVQLSRSVRLLATPGHTPQDLTVLVGTADAVAALTHLWWTAAGPADDPYAPDRRLLEQQRRRVRALAGLIVPGHGAPFVPGEDLPL